MPLPKIRSGNVIRVEEEDNGRCLKALFTFIIVVASTLRLGLRFLREENRPSVQIKGNEEGLRDCDVGWGSGVEDLICRASGGGEDVDFNNLRGRDVQVREELSVEIWYGC